MTAAIDRDWLNYLGGRYESASQSPERIPAVDPATRKAHASIVASSAEDIDRAVREADRAFRQTWRKTTGVQRAALLNRLADEIERRSAGLAEAEVRDNGKLYREMLAQLRSIPKWYRYFAGIADKIHGATIPLERQSIVAITTREPLGVVGCITPWNSPLLLSAFALAPALAAGNTVVVKPSEHAAVSSLLLAECFEAAGFPPGVYNVVTGYGAVAGSALTAHPLVRCLCFTGSPAAGAQVAAAASSRFAKVILELGGKSANIVFADADADAALAGALGGVFSASGQSCIAGSRLLVQRPVYDQMLERLAGRAATIQVGDPMDERTEMGPVANEPQYDKTLGYIGVAAAEGARLLSGGEPAAEAGPGYYLRPTIFCDVAPGMRIAQEEVFGPILAVLPFDTDEEAVALANDTRFGLAAGLWTSNVSRAHAMSRRLEAGTVWVNTYRALSPAMPFGGVKDSGLGRENGAGAISDFTHDKSIWLETEPSPADPFVMRL